MLLDRIADAFMNVRYPVDLGRMVGDITAILQEHHLSDIPISEAMIRNAVLTSLDLLDGGQYDLDMLLLEELDNDDKIGFHELDRVTEALRQLREPDS